MEKAAAGDPRRRAGTGQAGGGPVAQYDAAQSRPLPGEEVPKSEPLKGTDHRHNGATLSGAGEHQRVEAAVRLVTTQLQGGVARVSQHIQVVDRIPAA
jgi:hypothetical protein